jgi:hypothetical protein
MQNQLFILLVFLQKRSWKWFAAKCQDSRGYLPAEAIIEETG